MQRFLPLLFFFLLGFIFTVSAQPTGSLPTQSQDLSPTVRPTRSFVPRNSQPPKVRASVTLKPTISIPFERRDQAKKLQCERLKEVINQKEDNVIRHVANIQEHFDSIVQRVDTYYKSKLIPANQTVPNYQTLLNNIAAKKTALQDELDQLHNAVETSSCDSENPGYVTSLIKEDIRAVIAAINDYKKSVRDLIVGVHSSNSDRDNPTATPTAITVSLSPTP